MKKITQELKNKSIIELEKEIEILREEIARLALETKVSPPKDTNLLYKKKKRLAIFLTILTKKKEEEEIKKIKS